MNYRTDAGLLRGVNNKQTWTMYGFLSSFFNICNKVLILTHFNSKHCSFYNVQKISYVLEYLAFLVLGSLYLIDFNFTFNIQLFSSLLFIFEGIMPLIGSKLNDSELNM